MLAFKSEEQNRLQLLDREAIDNEDKLFEMIHKLTYGINAGDVKKLQDAGIYTCNGLMMHAKKSLTGIKGLSEAKDEKICEAAEKIVNFGYITGSDVLIMDSVIALFRVDFTGRGELADPVYMTNQVIADPNGGVFISDPKKPEGVQVMNSSSEAKVVIEISSDSGEENPESDSGDSSDHNSNESNDDDGDSNANSDESNNDEEEEEEEDADDDEEEEEEDADDEEEDDDFRADLTARMNRNCFGLRMVVKKVITASEEGRKRIHLPRRRIMDYLSDQEREYFTHANSMEVDLVVIDLLQHLGRDRVNVSRWGNNFYLSGGGVSNLMNGEDNVYLFEGERIEIWGFRVLAAAGEGTQLCIAIKEILYDEEEDEEDDDEDLNQLRNNLNVVMNTYCSVLRMVVSKSITASDDAHRRIRLPRSFRDILSHQEREHFTNANSMEVDLITVSHYWYLGQHRVNISRWGIDFYVSGNGLTNLWNGESSIYLTEGNEIEIWSFRVLAAEGDKRATMGLEL